MRKLKVKTEEDRDLLGLLIVGVIGLAAVAIAILSESPAWVLN